MIKRQSGFSWPKALFVLALVAAGCWAWWYFAPGSLPEALRAQLPVAASPAHNPPLYKWKDAQGRWNLTDRPPEGRPYETVTVDPNTNVLPAGVPPEQD